MEDKITTTIRYRKISLICLFISIPMNLVNSLVGIKLMTIIGVALLAISFLTLFIFWKCPYCNEKLPWRFFTKHNNDMDGIYLCPYCNKYFKS